MDKFPVVWGDSSFGEMTVERDGQCSVFTVCCQLPGEDLWGVWAVGERGELRLGVLEGRDGCGMLKRRFSGQLTSPLGPLCRGELKQTAGRANLNWEMCVKPENLVQSPWLRRRLQGETGCMMRRNTDGILLALPYDAHRPFPLLSLFCFAAIRRIGTKQYVVYQFNRDGEVAFSAEKI